MGYFVKPKPTVIITNDEEVPVKIKEPKHICIYCKFHRRLKLYDSRINPEDRYDDEDIKDYCIRECMESTNYITGKTFVSNVCICEEHNRDGECENFTKKKDKGILLL